MPILFTKTIGIYEDHFEPTGCIYWLGTVQQLEVRKLLHELNLVIEGPDEMKGPALNYLGQPAVVTELSAIATGFSADGIRGTVDSWERFKGTFLTRLGKTVDVRLDHQSHWITWIT